MVLNAHLLTHNLSEFFYTSCAGEQIDVFLNISREPILLEKGG